MMADLPHTLYDFDRKGKGGKPGKVVQDEESLRLQQEALKKSAARRQRQSVETKHQDYTLDDLFNGVADDAPLINGK